MLFNRFLITSLLLSSSVLFSASDDWVSVSRPEKVAHQMEQDRSIWVVFSKTFGDERVLVRFPEDPIYRHRDGCFEAIASHLGVGEITLLAQKINSQMRPQNGDTMYRDEHGMWVQERHIISGEYYYILRVAHPSQSISLFRQFADSFEIEKGFPQVQ